MTESKDQTSAELLESRNIRKGISRLGKGVALAMVLISGLVFAYPDAASAELYVCPEGSYQVPLSQSSTGCLNSYTGAEVSAVPESYVSGSYTYATTGQLAPVPAPANQNLTGGTTGGWISARCAGALVGLGADGAALNATRARAKYYGAAVPVAELTGQLIAKRAFVAGGLLILINDVYNNCPVRPVENDPHFKHASYGCDPTITMKIDVVFGSGAYRYSFQTWETGRLYAETVHYSKTCHYQASVFGAGTYTQSRPAKYRIAYNCYEGWYLARSAYNYNKWVCKSASA